MPIVAIAVVPSVDRAAPIAASMVVVRPETIGPHPEGAETKCKTAARGFPGPRGMAAQRTGEENAAPLLREAIEAKPVFGQTQSIRGRRGRGLPDEEEPPQWRSTGFTAQKALGSVRTLTLGKAVITFPRKYDGDNGRSRLSPFFALTPFAFDAAWKFISAPGQRLPPHQADDPRLPAPIYARLVEITARTMHLHLILRSVAA
ncbi:hypothetical protein ACWGTI_23495 [Mesorhizobium sp. ArgA1]